MAIMMGLDQAQAAAVAVQRLDWKRMKELRFEMTPLCEALVKAQVDYLHACGALDEEGYAADGEYDEDEAVEFLLDALTSAFPADGAREALYCTLIDAFLPVFDDYLYSVGLLSL